MLLSVLLTTVVSAENEVTIDVLEGAEEAEAGSKAIYEVSLTNLQPDRDIYRISYNELSVYPFSDFARSIMTEPSQLKLDPEETGTMIVTIKVLENALEDKSYEMPLTVTSLTNENIAVEFTLKTYVVAAEDVILIFPEIPDTVIPGEDQEIKVRLKNRGNIALENYEILISSDLPQLYKNFITDFGPGEEIIETVILKTDKNTHAGDYVVNIHAYDSDSKTRGSYSSAFTIESFDNIREKKDKDLGFFSKTTTITKTNEGNIQNELMVEAKVNFLARMFTNTEPQASVSKGKYIWTVDLAPGESTVVKYTSNYRPIFYGLIIVALAVWLMTHLIDRSVIIRKRLYRIKKTADGLSELKVLIHVRNGKTEDITDVRISDVLPNTMQPLDEFGTMRPTKVQQGTKGKRFVWDIPHLAPHEERIFSYKVKTRLKLIGDARLPPSIVQYQTKKGKHFTERSASLALEHKQQ